MKHSRVKCIVLTAGEGVISTIVDTTLTALYIAMVASTVHTMGEAMRSVEEVSYLKDRVNYKTIKRAIYSLTHQRLITRTTKRSSLDLAITKLGMKRIEACIPTYLTNRPWDGYIYLISYDIPTKSNTTRDMLRRYIKKTGGALLQESLWINPYNPTILLETFMREHEVSGTILVSKLGRDGTIGEEKLPDVVARIYKLNELSARYGDFLKTYEDVKPLPLIGCIFDYMAILKDDPQLPFSLLPPGFSGGKAYALVKLHLPHLFHTS